MFCARGQTAEGNEIREKKVERYDRVLSEDQDRERSIEQVSPSLTAFRNAAKNKKKEERER